MLLALFAALPAQQAAAQVRSVDPNTVIDADLDQPAPPPSTQAPLPDAPSVPNTLPDAEPSSIPQEYPATPPQGGVVPANNGAGGPTYQRDDLIGAAEGVFGRGAQGVARMIENILREQGEPNGYIVGREASGAFILGLRYGSGTLHHRVEGQMPVYWNGPSVGLDAGANAGSTFVLVYNLYDSDDLFHRYVAGEGAAYVVGGLNASYMRRGDVVLIPIRMGLGLRLGANVGYMRLSRQQRWLPF